jgi:hypothetical protein
MASDPLPVRTHYTNWLNTSPQLPIPTIAYSSFVFLKVEKRWDVIDDERNSQCFRPRYPRDPPFLTNFPDPPHLSPEEKEASKPLKLQLEGHVVPDIVNELLETQTLDTAKLAPIVPVDQLTSRNFSSSMLNCWSQSYWDHGCQCICTTGAACTGACMVKAKGSGPAAYFIKPSSKTFLNLCINFSLKSAFSFSSVSTFVKRVPEYHKTLSPCTSATVCCLPMCAGSKRWSWKGIWTTLLRQRSKP